MAYFYHTDDNVFQQDFLHDRTKLQVKTLPGCQNYVMIFKLNNTIISQIKKLLNQIYNELKRKLQQRIFLYKINQCLKSFDKNNTNKEF